MKKVKYSEVELKLISLLPADGSKISSADLVKKYYGKNDIPFNGPAIIVGRMTGLIRKNKHNKEKYTINKSKRAGPRPIDYWLS